MRFYLMKRDQVVASFLLDTWLTDFSVSDFCVEKETDLPESIKINKKYNLEIPWDDLFSFWIKNRLIPNSRIHLDELLLSVYHLQSFQFGRMMQYQHTAAILSYFSSGFDDYYMTPEDIFLICYVYQDIRFPNLYFLKPIDWKGVQSFRDYPNPIVESCFYEKKNLSPGETICSCSFSIPSSVPSWWENERRFVQEYDSDNFKEVSTLRKYQKFQNRKIITDFSWLKGNVLWISDLKLKQDEFCNEFGNDCFKKIKELNQFYPATGIGLLTDQKEQMITIL